MATDVRALMENIASRYDFRDKSVIHVGAGGGRLAGYARDARSVLAVDSDAEAVRRLGVALREQGLVSRFIVFKGELASVRARADVVFFEFCLHETAEPGAALQHARTLAPETLVVDHAPGSRWSWYRGEEAGVERAWQAVGRLAVARDETLMGAEQFHDYDELLAAVGARGEPTLGRIAELRGRQGIAIQMPYRIALLH
ncbi:MAG TPA: methyltransferase domain-containing protein [Gemmatimonadales bacterium]|nr:methyltransferase domain-containing protein [Gemmatimonadales bacterium]